MGFIDDLKQEAKSALPELKEVVKKELKDQISKRLNKDATAAPVASAAPQMISPAIMIGVAAVLVGFLILRK